MKRDLGTMIRVMLLFIPKDKETAILRTELERIYNSVLYAPPEMANSWWVECANVLADYESKYIETVWWEYIPNIWLERQVTCTNP